MIPEVYNALQNLPKDIQIDPAFKKRFLTQFYTRHGTVPIIRISTMSLAKK